MHTLRQNLRHAFRMMISQKAFTAAALVTLALGIGATTAIFSVVNGVLLQPLPYPNASRLVNVAEDRGLPGPVARMTNYTFHAWRQAPKTIDALVAYNSRAYTVTGEGDPERMRGAAVSPELFEMLGVTPALGRFFEPGSEAPGTEATVVLGYGAWQDRFGGAQSVLGRTMMLDGRAHTIIGVARPDFSFPDRDARLWTPYAVPAPSANTDQIRIATFGALARLAPGSTPEHAAAEGSAAAANSNVPAMFGGRQGSTAPTVRVDTMVNTMTAQIRPALLVLSVGVVFVLLIGCANVANLFLSRGVARERELALRASLGAGRGRLLIQLLSESLVIALIGGALGLVVSWGLLEALRLLAPANFPRLAEVRIDGVVLGFAAGASIVAGLISGVVPAFRASRVDLVSVLRDGMATSTGVRMVRVRSVLLVAEAAFAVMLLIGSGLLVRSFVRLVQVDAGYTAESVLTAQIFLPGAGRPGGGGEPDPVMAARSAAFTEAVVSRVTALPGVEVAGTGNMAPLGGGIAMGAFRLPGVVGSDGAPVFARATDYSVTPGYAEALGLRLRDGRFLNDADRTAAVRALVVNDAFAAAYLSDGRPIVGRRLEGLAGPGVTTEIVGVVGNVLLGGLDTAPQPEMYNPVGEDSPQTGRVYLVVKTTSDPMAIVPALRSIVREADQGAALDAVGLLTARVSESVGQQRLAATLLAGFAGLALGLAAIGLYGVLSYNVSRQRRELGVRAALGATRTDIVRLVVRQGLGVTMIGLLLGVVGAAALTRLMQQMLFGVTALDWVSFTAAPAVLLVVALVACVVPARRAAGTDPAEALRYQ